MSEIKKNAEEATKDVSGEEHCTHEDLSESSDPLTSVGATASASASATADIVQSLLPADMSESTDPLISVGEEGSATPDIAVSPIPADVADGSTVSSGDEDSAFVDESSTLPVAASTCTRPEQDITASIDCQQTTAPADREQSSGASIEEARSAPGSLDVATVALSSVDNSEVHQESGAVASGGDISAQESEELGACALVPVNMQNIRVPPWAAGCQDQPPLLWRPAEYGEAQVMTRSGPAGISDSTHVTENEQTNNATSYRELAIGELSQL